MSESVSAQVLEHSGSGSMEVIKKYQRYIWNDYEDGILIECVKESPNNIKRALSNAADILGIDFDRCKNRWYAHGLKDKYKEEKVTVNIKDLTSQVVETMDTFLDIMSKLHKVNTDMRRQIVDQSRQIDSQQHTIKHMHQDFKDMEDSYSTVMKVMEKARKMYVDEELNALDKKNA